MPNQWKAAMQSGTPPEEMPVYPQIIPVLMKLDVMYTSLAGQLQDIR